jgi:hypothetical protein
MKIDLKDHFTTEITTELDEFLGAVARVPRG